MGKLKLIVLVGLCIYGFSACNTASTKEESPDTTVVTDKKERPNSLKLGKIFEKEGKKLLYGGKKDYQHFDITDWTLNESQLHYGIGREEFDALIEPKFISLDEANKEYLDTSRFLLAVGKNDIKAYAIKLLTHHEVINDVLDGEPIMAAYCHLADLGAIYSRNYDGAKFTFGLSGYTYYDKEVWNGMDGFLLWDRETESIWWPLTGYAVSGTMKGKKLAVLDEKKWSQTTWKHIKSKYPQIKVLAKDQTMEEPKNWEKYPKEMFNISPEENSKEHVAPKWGDNASI